MPRHKRVRSPSRHYASIIDKHHMMAMPRGLTPPPPPATCNTIFAHRSVPIKVSMAHQGSSAPISTEVEKIAVERLQHVHTYATHTPKIFLSNAFHPEIYTRFIEERV